MHQSTVKKGLKYEEPFLAYNQNISQREKQNPRHIRFLEWCRENGFKSSGVEFPAYFGEDGQLRGVVCTKDIAPYEVVMAVPNKILITATKAREDEDLQPLFDGHELFKDPDDGDYNTLIVFLLREKLKGEQSFWAPFIQLVPEIESGIVWDKQTLEFVEEPAFKEEIEEAQDDFEKEWKTIQSVLQNYSALFPK